MVREQLEDRERQKKHAVPLESLSFCEDSLLNVGLARAFLPDHRLWRQLLERLRPDAPVP